MFLQSKPAVLDISATSSIQMPALPDLEKVAPSNAVRVELRRVRSGHEVLSLLNEVEAWKSSTGGCWPPAIGSRAMVLERDHRHVQRLHFRLETLIKNALTSNTREAVQEADDIARSIFAVNNLSIRLGWTICENLRELKAQIPVIGILYAPSVLWSRQVKTLHLTPEEIATSFRP